MSKKDLAKLAKNGVSIKQDDLLQPRIVTNAGKNKIILKPDTKFTYYVTKMGTMMLAEPIELLPNESRVLLNFYVIIETDDGHPARIFQNFDLDNFLPVAKKQVLNETN